jgi:GTPase KRas protein
LQYEPTIEDTYRKQVLVDNQSCTLEVLDSAGAGEYRALEHQWIRSGEGFLLVYSISSRISFERIQTFHNQIHRVKESEAPSTPYPGSPISRAAPSTPIPIILVGNKSDRATEREVSIHEGRVLAQKLGCAFLETSAKNGIAVEDAFYDIIRQLQRRRMQSGVGCIQRFKKWPRMGVGDETDSRDCWLYRPKKDGYKCTIS